MIIVQTIQTVVEKAASVFLWLLQCSLAFIFSFEHNKFQTRSTTFNIVNHATYFVMDIPTITTHTAVSNTMDITVLICWSVEIIKSASSQAT